MPRKYLHARVTPRFHSLRKRGFHLTYTRRLLTMLIPVLLFSMACITINEWWFLKKLFTQNPKSYLEMIRTHLESTFFDHMEIPRSALIEDDLENWNSTGKDSYACIMPRLNPFDDQIMPFEERPLPLTCDGEDNWVYVEKGKVRIKEDIGARGLVSCDIQEFEGKGSYIVVKSHIINNIPDGFQLTKDFFRVSCISSDGKNYVNVHLGVSYKPELQARGQATPLPPRAMGGYDVLMFGFDSTSRMAWQRNLPNTRRFFLNELGAIEFEGFNILGDGTVDALMPLLTGHVEMDMLMTRRDHPSPVDVDILPFIWSKFHEAGYVTAWGEDSSEIGTFEFRLTGFKETPVDHYMRPYFVTAENYYGLDSNVGCLGSEVKHVRFYNYFKEMYQMYGSKRKFMFGFHSEFSHDDSNKLKWLDEDFRDVLRNLSDSGYLNHTILILMSDHGARFSEVRETQQGKMEERLPYFGIYFPPEFHARYPREVEQVRLNRKRLTTMLDVHETLHDLLDNDPLKPTKTKGRGISLFKPIPKDRRCSQAGIQPHWCACLNWKNVSHDSWLQLSTATAVVNYINDLTKKVRDRCEELSLELVLSAVKYVPHQKLLRFIKSMGFHGDTLRFRRRLKTEFEYIQVTFTTTPGKGRFEATVKHSIKEDRFHVTARDISRINRYGNASSCVIDYFPSLRAYCYCNHLKNYA